MKFARQWKWIGSLMIVFLSGCSAAGNMQDAPSTVTSQPVESQKQVLPMFRGSLDHTGIYDSTPIKTLQGVKWKFNAEGAIVTSPAVSDGQLYFGTQKGDLIALNLEKGVEIWRFHIEKPINSSPAVSNGLVYFEGNDGFVYALDAKSGAEKWKADTGPDRPTDYDNISSSPAVSDGAVFIAGGNGNLYALNADTGETLWSVPALGFNALRSSPAVDGDTVYFTAEKSLLALDVKSGAEKWTYHFITLTRSSPAIGDSVIVFGDQGSTIYGVDSKTGLEKWKYRINYYWVTSTAAISDGIVYIGGDDSYLNALNAQTGEVKWRFKTSGETVWSSPALADDVLYLGDWNFSNIKDENGNTKWGYLHAVDKNSGEELWNFKTGGNIVSSPVIIDGVLYFGSMDGYLYALH